MICLLTTPARPVLEIPDEGQNRLDLAVGNKLGRGAVAIVCDRLVAIPVDRLVDIAGEFRGGRDYLDHLAHPALQALRRGIAQCVAVEALFPEARLRRRALVRLVAGGRARLKDRTALASAVESARPDFAYLEFDDGALATECEAGDLDAIDRAGALREAADALLAEAGDAARSAEEREIARAALGRLYAYAQRVAP